MIRRMWANQRGQALMLVLGFMFLAVPLITGVLALASTFAIDARVKTDILKSQYASLGAQQYVVHALLSDTSTLPIELNGKTVTTTIEQLDSPPGPLPFPPSADSNRRLFTFIDVSPTSTPASDATTTREVTYTIRVENRDDKKTSPSGLTAEMSAGFGLVDGSSVVTSPSGAVNGFTTSTSGSTVSWGSLGTTLDVGEQMTVEFRATVPTVDGFYCAEVSATPGGQSTRSGKSGKLTVGSSTDFLCKGDSVSVTAVVSPTVVMATTSELTFTYTVTIVNEGDTVLNITSIDDITHDTPQFTYKALSVSSTPSDIQESGGSAAPLGEPKLFPSQDTIQWPKTGGTIYEMATNTTWIMSFGADVTVPLGQYYDEVQLNFAGNQLSAGWTTWKTALITVIEVYKITVTDGESTYTCYVWLGAAFDPDTQTQTPFNVVESCELVAEG